MNDALATHVESLDIGVVNFGGARHLVDSDGLFTSFFCGLRGVRVKKRHWWLKPTCPGCIHEARRVQIKGV